MSNDQYPNPWSREASWKRASTPADGEPATPQPTAPQGQPSAPAPQPSVPPVQRSAPAPQPSAPQAQPSAPGRVGGPQPMPGAVAPWSQPRPNDPWAPRPQQQWAEREDRTQPLSIGTWSDRPTPQYQAPQSAPAAAPKKKRGSRAAGLLAAMVLAAGVGGGAGVGAMHLLDEEPVAQPTVTVSTPAQGTTTEVVQADPANPNWSVVAEQASKSVVAIQVMGSGSGGQGSGVVIDGEGHIVTNNHVVMGSGADATITVLLGTTSYAAEMVGTDPSTDLAVIKMVDPPAELNVMSYGDVTELAVGDPVMAIGNPLGLADTVTTGIVSALDRPVTTRAVGATNASADDVVVTAAIQTNAAINPGNSGGALVDGAGKLIGITSSIASLPSASGSASGNIGIGFAIGADQVKYVADQLIATGEAQHPQIGIHAGNIRGTGRVGAQVAQVVEGSPAQAAGVQVGDLVTAVDGKPVMNMESLVALVRAGQVGRDMTLTVMRDGESLDLIITPIAAPR